MSAFHHIEELRANAKSLKEESRKRTPDDHYLLVKVYGGVPLDQLVTNDSSFVGLFWVYPRDREGSKNLYLIFGPTENPRFLSGDHQKIVSYYGTSYGKQARAYTLKTKLEVLIILQADLVEIAIEDVADDLSLGLVVNKNKEGLQITKKELSTFVLEMQKFLFGF